MVCAAPGVHAPLLALVGQAPNTDPAQRHRAWLALAQVESDERNPAAAQALCDQILQADPQDLLDALTLKRLQARMTAPELAQFIVADGRVPPLFEPCLGTLESPEGGATIFLRVTALGGGAQWQLTGPGIATTQALAISGLDPAWIARRQDWNEGFPLGVDLILVDTNSVVALPRTTLAADATQMAVQGETTWAM